MKSPATSYNFLWYSLVVNDTVIQIEVVLNFLNTLLSKAIFFKDGESIEKLHTLRHVVYYGSNFEYDSMLRKLQEIEVILKHYE